MEKIKKLVLTREAVKRLHVRAGIRTGAFQVSDNSNSTSTSDIDSGGPYKPSTSHQGGGVQSSASLISPPSGSG